MDFFDLAPQPAGGTPSANPVLERNLTALRRTSPRTADLIAAAEPTDLVEFVDTPDGVPGLVLNERAAGLEFEISQGDPLGLGLGGGAGSGGASTRGRVLASRRRPLAEAAKLADTIDVGETAGICVLGFGAGYHCRALGEKLRTAGVVVCYEPDLGLLRAVLERVDHSGWINESHFILLTNPEDAPAIGTALQGYEGMVALGVRILEHPPSRDRLGETGTQFGAAFANTMKAVRTQVVTTLVHAQTTLRNLVMNADRYAESPGVEELRGVASGRPAVVVSAGPSLARNIEVLSRPGVRDRVVIVAVQTVLKTLLAAGIQPHYVTSLDHHELSRRFYEGLTPEDVEGVTLVVEPKANPAVLEAFPGSIRCVGDQRLDELLGPILPGSHGDLTAGATVAHLSYYLARHLGCDPVILIGQDLGFTDGQYYAAGAAIHDVWAGELNPFRTLEMFEWERIARERSLLRPMTDVHGRPIYSDEQMSTYLAQFEVEFAADEARGLRTIDATEGGVRKRHTEVMTLEQAIDTLWDVGPHALPEPERPGGSAVKRAVLDRVRTVNADARKVAKASREAASILRKMLGAHGDHAKVNRLIDEVYAVRDRVRTLEPAYGLVQFLNQDARLNFAQNLLRRRDEGLALAFWAEDKVKRRLSHATLYDQVSRMAQALRALGVKPGDRVAGLLPNMPEAIISMLGATAIGATWASASPDFGVQGVLDRFRQIEPTVLIVCDGYFYNGKTIRLADKVKTVVPELPTVKTVVVVPLIGDLGAFDGIATTYDDVIGPQPGGDIAFEQLPFDHPLYIMFSSGTTGVPKCIVHRAGGVLLQHLKEHLLHCDVRQDDRVFYFTTLGWMMWNWMVSGLAAGAALLLV